MATLVTYAVLAVGLAAFMGLTFLAERGFFISSRGHHTRRPVSGHSGLDAPASTPRTAKDHLT